MRKIKKLVLASVEANVENGLVVKHDNFESSNNTIKVYPKTFYVKKVEDNMNQKLIEKHNYKDDLKSHQMQ